ncbi:MAG: tetratricopeptide repeat protein, partial [Sphingopyxis sp.]
RLDLARAYNALGRGVEAERQLRSAQTHGASDATIRTELANAQLLQGQAEAALTTLQGPVPRSDGARAMRIAGTAQYQLGRADVARQSLNAATRMGADDPANWIALAKFRLAEQDVVGADGAADEAWRRGPQSAAALAIKADVVRTRGGPVVAIPWYRAAVERDPDNVPAMLELAASLGDAGRYREMLSPLRRAADLEPRNPRALFLQAVVAARGGELPLARTLLNRIGGADADVPAVLQLRAATALALETPREAEGFASRLVALQPENIVARQLLAIAQAKGDNPRGAIITLDPITTRPDADSWSLILLARSFSALDWQVDAAQPLDRAATLRRGDAPPLSAQGDPGDSLNPAVAVPAIRARLAAGQVDAALQLALRLAQINPGVPQAQLLVGDALLASGDAARAADYFLKSAQLRYDEGTMLRLVNAQQRAGDRDGAAQSLQQYMARWPENVAAMRIAASFAADQGDWAAARAALVPVNDRTGSFDALVLAQIARCELELGDAGAALPWAARAYRRLPANATVSGVYGIAMARSGGNQQDSRDLMAKALSIAPDDALIRRWYGEVVAAR